jgi:hypothetical protein
VIYNNEYKEIWEWSCENLKIKDFS